MPEHDEAYYQAQFADRAARERPAAQPEQPPIRVRSVIGTGNPMDTVFMLPLVGQWGATRACTLARDNSDDPRCERMIGRIVVLAEPGIIDDNGQGQSVLAFCEEDFLAWRSKWSPKTV
jgi:hypothetical protein